MFSLKNRFNTNNCNFVIQFKNYSNIEDRFSNILLKIFCKIFGGNKNSLYLCNVKKRGSIAQLVQSICLTSRGSAVRIRVLPRNEEVVSSQSPFSFVCRINNHILAIGERVFEKNRYICQYEFLIINVLWLQLKLSI